MSQKILYVVDITSRQYPFHITESGVTLKYSGNTVIITEDNIPIDLLHSIIEQKITFTLSNDQILACFNPDNLIGIQIFN